MYPPSYDQPTSTASSIALIIAIYKCLKMVIRLVIGLVVGIYKFFRILVLLVKGLAIAMYKFFRILVLLVKGLAVATYKFFRILVLLVKGLAIAMYKFSVAMYKCFKMTALGTLYLYKLLKPSANLCISSCSKANDPEDNRTNEVVVEIEEPEDRISSVERLLSIMARERPIRYAPEELAGITNDYMIKLGSGGFGDVYKGELENGLKVAVKVLKDESGKRVQEQFMSEVSTIGRTYHVNLVKLFGFCFSPTKQALVYEFMENGSLDTLLFGNNKATEWGKLHEIAIGTAKAIAYLHEGCEQRIIHYDIKPANILLDGNLNPKVADFGLAQLCKTEASLISLAGYRGTPGYAAPELWMPYPITRKCDVYSYGMLLFEIVSRRENFDKVTEQWVPRLVWDMFANGELLETVSRFGIEEGEREKAMRACLVALWCVQYVAEARPIMSTVVKMLEGVTEIPPPPNPFEHLRLNGSNSNNFDSEGGYSDSMATSSSFLRR